MTEMFPEEPTGLEDLEPLDITPILMRRLTWDVLPCDEVAPLLGKLGMTPAPADGLEVEHQESHRRMACVVPLESFFIKASAILGSVVSLAMTEARGVTDQVEDMDKFAEQNAEVALVSARAVIAQLFDENILMYTPEALAAMSL